MGQKMASGFKFKKRNLFERVNSQPTNTRHTSTSSLSSTLAGTTIDQGSSATSPDTNHSRSPYLSTDTSSSFEGYHSQSTQDATPRPAFFNQSPKQPYTYSSNGNSPTLGSLDLESCESINDFPEPDHSPPALDQRSRSYGGMDRPSPYAPQSRRQTHMRLSASDASHFHPINQPANAGRARGPSHLIIIIIISRLLPNLCLSTPCSSLPLLPLILNRVPIEQKLARITSIFFFIQDGLSRVHFFTHPSFEFQIKNFVVPFISSEERAL
ncbi:hypothetical protein PGT21_003942 [Puccinia graminis f. sp. tritici]|uniref:Uncharacterized protein n=1 Tax=Puccinia graminis f. sp. tritici TaxID=56615 RepID=A0A5B0P5J7_PUCGR|nr:hypothetical protein PGT21_003942 [Puccinia graminis f. sp. tritici]